MNLTLITTGILKYLVKVTLRILSITLLLVFLLSGLCVVVPAVLWILGHSNSIESTMEFWEYVNDCINNI